MVEFLVPADPAAGTDEIVDTGSARTGRRDRLRNTAAAVLWAMAAVLAALASFARVYTIAFGSGASAFRYSSDGWGRLTGFAADPDQYGPRFGIVFTFCAVGSAVLAVAGIARAADRLPQRLSAAQTGVGIAVAGILAGVVAAVVLHVATTLDNVRTSLHRQVSNGDPIRADLHTSNGACTYFGLAALAAMVLALGTATRERRLRSEPRV